jgi:hypothetical protein
MRVLLLQVDRHLRKLDQELAKFKMELEADNAGITEILERREAPCSFHLHALGAILPNGLGYGSKPSLTAILGTLVSLRAAPVTAPPPFHCCRVFGDGQSRPAGQQPPRPLSRHG